MSDILSLPMVLKALKKSLRDADESLNDTSIGSAEVTLMFSISQDSEANVELDFRTSSQNPSASKLTLRFEHKQPNTSQLSLSEDDINDIDDDSNDGFEAFKQRFEATVKRKHGQTPNKKKNIFDCD